LTAGDKRHAGKVDLRDPKYVPAVEAALKEMDLDGAALSPARCTN
jgi:hypothetical protein